MTGLRARVGLLLLFLVGGLLQGDTPTTLPEWPRTDGSGLPPPPPSRGLRDWQRQLAERQRACDGPCVTPFGQVLGIADGVEAHSNCLSTCVRPERRILDLASGAVRPWPDAHTQARQISLFEINGRFTVLDVPPDRRANAHGGQIGGWVYPLP